MSPPIEVRLSPAGDPMNDNAYLREAATRYLIWDLFVGGARRVDLHPLVLGPELHARAVATAESVVRGIDRFVAARAFTDPDERARYGFSREVERMAFASDVSHDRSSLVRVDLLLDTELQWRVCEINADCPGGHNEALGLPRLAQRAGFAGAMNPTHVVEALVQALTEMSYWEDGSQGAVALLHATAYAEDLQVCALLQRWLADRGVDAILCPATAPRLASDGLLYVADVPVRVLYRFVPCEWMEQQRNVGEIVEAVGSGMARTMSSFASMYTQSKLSLARAWALQHQLSPEIARGLTRAIPETFDLADVRREWLLGDPESWVLKRTLGRVGDDVFVGSLMPEDAWMHIVGLATKLCASGDRWIAQRFVEQHPIPTPWGEQLVTLGAYVLDGRFAGYYARVTAESHVSHDALCLPVFAEALP